MKMIVGKNRGVEIDAEKIIVGEERVDIDVGKMTISIDEIFHQEITGKTGVIIGHSRIICFITDFITEYNANELRIQYEEEQERKEMQRAEEGIKRNIERGKVVRNLDSWSNRIKYYFLGYIYTNGEGDKDGR